MKQWKIRFQGCEYGEADVTPLDVAVVIKLADVEDWSVLEPRSSPIVLTSWTILAVARNLNCAIDEASMMVHTASMLEVLSGFVEEEVDPPPKDDDDGDSASKLNAEQRRAVMRKLVEARARQVAEMEG